VSRRKTKKNIAKQSAAITTTKNSGNQSTKETQIIEQSFSGPLPTPAILEQYDHLLPGAAERILSMAENDASHQRDIEITALNAQARENRRGQYCGVFVVVIAFATAIVALSLGHPTAASVIGGTTVVGLATAFAIGRKSK